MDITILHRKERLIITTIDIIDELGIQKLTTREIARRQGISEATLFRHFKNKSDLLLAVLDYFSQYDLDIYESIKMKHLDAKESILYLITSYAEYYENYPAITSIMQVYEVLLREAELKEKVQEIFKSRHDILAQLIDAGKDAGVIKNTVDGCRLAVIITGLCREICLKWRFEGRTFSLKDETIATLKLVLDAK